MTPNEESVGELADRLGISLPGSVRIGVPTEGKHALVRKALRRRRQTLEGHPGLGGRPLRDCPHDESALVTYSRPKEGGMGRRDYRTCRLCKNEYERNRKKRVKDGNVLRSDGNDQRPTVDSVPEPSDPDGAQST